MAAKKVLDGLVRREAEIQAGVKYCVYGSLDSVAKNGDILECLAVTDTSANFINLRTKSKFGCRKDNLIGHLVTSIQHVMRAAVKAAKQALTRNDIQGSVLLFRETRDNFGVLEGDEREETTYIEMAAAREAAIADDENVFKDLF